MNVLRRNPNPRPEKCLRFGQATTLRHGSNVPGPLEARRRASKRRYTGALSPYVDLAAIDAAVLLSLRPRSNDPPTATASPIPRSPTLMGTGWERLKISPWLPTFSKDVDLSAPATTEERDKLLAMFPPSNVFEACTSLYEITQLASQSRITFQEAWVSRQAFERLCSLQLELSQLLDFLTDRSLNPPEAKNFVYMLQRLHDVMSFDTLPREQQTVIATHLSTWIKQEILSGNLAESEVRDLLRLVADASSSSYIAPRIFSYEIIRSVCRGLLDSTIRPPSEVQPATIRCLARALASKRFLGAPSCVRLIIEVLQKACNGNQHRLLSVLQIFLRTFLNHPNSTVQFKESLRALKLMTQNGKASLLYMALDSIYAMRDLSIRHGKWLEFCLSEPQFANWILLRCGHDSHAEPNAVRVSDLRSEDGCKFLLKAWLIPVAKRLLRPSLRVNGSLCSSEAELHKAAEDCIRISEGDAKQTSYNGLLQFSYEASKPLATKLSTVLLTVFSQSSNLATLYLILQQCQRLNIFVPQLVVRNAINKLATRYPNQALSLFMHDTRLELQGSLPLVAGIIASPSIPNELLLPLFARSASFYGPRPTVLPLNERSLFVYSVARMLERSNSPVTSQLALISRLLDMLVTFVPSDAMMRSLIHGEIIDAMRRGESLSPRTRLKVLSRVSNVEGAAVCERLEILLQGWEMKLETQKRLSVEVE